MHYFVSFVILFLFNLAIYLFFILDSFKSCFVNENQTSLCLTCIDEYCELVFVVF